MKRVLVALSLMLASATAAAADIGVSISIGDPHFYGRIDIGDFPPPRLVYREPLIIERVRVVPAPIYLRVPPGHAKHWSKHCRAYNACGQRVYFVQDTWYNDVYAPRYRERHEDREERRDDRAERREDKQERKEGKGRGKGQGKHKGHDE